MTPPEFKAAREALGLSLTGMAQALRLGKNGRDTVRMWESDGNVRGIPGPVQIAVECLLKHGRKRAVAARLHDFPQDQPK